MSEANNNGTGASDLLGHVATITIAYVSRNQISAGDLPSLISRVYGSLSGLEGASTEAQARQVPAVPIKKSVRSDAIVCLECGQALKTLRRHLAHAHGLTPEEYRAKWGLRDEYPMIAFEYAARRSAVAKAIGLGRRRTAPPAPEPEPAKPVRKRRRKATST